MTIAMALFILLGIMLGIKYIVYYAMAFYVICDYIRYRGRIYREKREYDELIAKMQYCANLGRVAPNAQPNQRPMAKKVAWIASLVLGFAALYLIVQVATTISSS